MQANASTRERAGTCKPTHCLTACQRVVLPKTDAACYRVEGVGNDYWVTTNCVHVAICVGAGMTADQNLLTTCQPHFATCHIRWLYVRQCCCAARHLCAVPCLMLCRVMREGVAGHPTSCLLQETVEYAGVLIDLCDDRCTAACRLPPQLAATSTCNHAGPATSYHVQPWCCNKDAVLLLSHALFPTGPPSRTWLLLHREAVRVACCKQLLQHAVLQSCCAFFITEGYLAG